MSESWTSCRPGAITQMAERVRARRRNERLRITLFPVVAAILLVVVWAVPRRDATLDVAPDVGPNFAGISCHRVSQLAGDYKSGKLDAELHDQVERHLALCDKCRAMFARAEQLSIQRLAIPQHGQLASWRAPYEMALHNPAPTAPNP